jgi:hypothetical protein
MRFDTKILRAFQERLGYEADPDDSGWTFKALSAQKRWFKPLVAQKIGLYFVKAREGHVPQIGFYVKGEVDDTLRKNLGIEMNNVTSNITNGRYCKSVKEAYDESDDCWWGYCDITVEDEDEAVIDWLITVMKEVERRASFTLNNK